MKTKKIVISTYNFDLNWIELLFENGFSKEDVVIYNRSVDNVDWSKFGTVIHSENIGSNIYDILRYICSSYDNLSDINFFIKGNILFKFGSLGLEDSPEGKVKYNIKYPTSYYTTEKRLLRALRAEYFLPIERYHPATEIVINGGKFIQKYWVPPSDLPAQYFSSYEDLANSLFSNAICAPIEYQRFCPGANYVVPKEVILKYSIDLYEKLKTYCGYGPHWVNAETYFIERLFYQMWTEDLVEL